MCSVLSRPRIVSLLKIPLHTLKELYINVKEPCIHFKEPYTYQMDTWKSRIHIKCIHICVRLLLRVVSLLSFFPLFKIALYTLKRALHTLKRALYTLRRIHIKWIHVCVLLLPRVGSLLKIAQYILQRALHTLTRVKYTLKRALYISNWYMYVFFRCRGSFPSSK